LYHLNSGDKLQAFEASGCWCLILIMNGVQCAVVMFSEIVVERRFGFHRTVFVCERDVTPKTEIVRFLHRCYDPNSVIIFITAITCR